MEDETTQETTADTERGLKEDVEKDGGEEEEEKEDNEAGGEKDGDVDESQDSSKIAGRCLTWREPRSTAAMAAKSNGNDDSDREQRRRPVEDNTSNQTEATGRRRTRRVKVWVDSETRQQSMTTRMTPRSHGGVCDRVLDGWKGDSEMAMVAARATANKENEAWGALTLGRTASTPGLELGH
ncbi:hypothetical protein MTO96_007898 [Rhipicephalus appendiculatus]